MVDMNDVMVQRDMQSLTLTMVQMQEQMGIKVDQCNERPTLIQNSKELTVEQRLQAVCRAPVAPLGFWNRKPTEPDYKNDFKLTGETPKDLEKVGEMLQAVLANQHRLYDNDQMIMSVLKLHTQAQLESLRVCHSIRALAGGADLDKHVDQVLKNYASTVRWYADDHLASVPFKTLAEIREFFTSAERITALQKYLLNFLQYDPAFFPRQVNEMCIHPKLKAKVYWSTAKLNESVVLFQAIFATFT